MPGKNSLFDTQDRPLYDRIFLSQVHLYTILVVLAIEVAGVTRFYLIFPELRYTIECFVICMFFVFTDIMCFGGMLKAKYADPGYLIPGDKKDTDQDEVELETLSTGQASNQISNCKRCGYKRTHIRQSHCGRCNRCVDYMDHHCVFTDNCVGRKNMPYFFQFIIWSEVCLAIGEMLLLWKLYTANLEFERGAQGVVDAFLNAPFFVLYKYILGVSDGFEGSLATIDCTIMLTLMGLACIVG